MSTHLKFRRELRVYALKFAAPLLLAFGAFTMQAQGADCTVAALKALNVPKMTITSADDVAAAADKPRYCDVKGSVATDKEGAGPSSAGFEVMLPANWNSKFVFNGVGGLAGSLNPSVNPVDRALFLSRGYATGITDTGHLASEPTWEYTAPGKPNTPKITDYFYRSVHQVTLAAKQLVKSYYGSTTIAHSYFDGCSNGGKMGVIEAMRYPDDYDGIIAGAPWFDPLGTSLWGLKNSKAMLDAYIPPTLFPAIDAAIKKQCDSVDGSSDGLIQNPARCSFDPNALVPETLTQKQADALKTILRPVTDQKGHLVYPGTSVSNLSQAGPLAGGSMNELPTAPTDPSGAKPWATGMPTNWTLASGIISALGYYDAATNLNSQVEDNGVVKPEALKLLYHRMGNDIPSDPTKLKAFFNRGGKLIIYHGYDDDIISPYRSVWYYEDLADKKGGYEKVQAQARLFMVPGMLHCQGGTGPTAFDSLTPMENWVEKGVAPDSIVASHSTNNVVDRTMPLCVFPAMAKFSGSGDINQAANWSCPKGDQSLLMNGPNGVQSGVGSKRQGNLRILAKSQ